MSIAGNRMEDVLGDRRCIGKPAKNIPRTTFIPPNDDLIRLEHDAFSSSIESRIIRYISEPGPGNAEIEFLRTMATSVDGVA